MIGGNPRKLSLPGATLENIFSLRSLDDSTRIKKALPQDEPLNIVIIGSGFIGKTISHPDFLT